MTSANPILITGGAGFVGRHLVTALAKRLSGSRCVVGSRDGADVGGLDDFVVFDVIDAEATHAEIARIRPCAVIHLAAQASVGAASEARVQTWRANFEGTLNVATAMARHVPTATLLHISTAEVYGTTFFDGVATEDSPLRPTNTYARSKAAAEWMLADAFPKTGRLIVVRPFNHTGPGQDERFVVPSFAAQIARIEAGLAEPILSVGNLEARRTFLDVRDVVRAYAMLIESAAGLPAYSVFNIASDRIERIHSILELLVRHARVPLSVVADASKMRPSEIEVAAGSSDRLYAAIGWSPEIELEQTLADVLAYQRAAVAPR